MIWSGEEVELLRKLYLENKELKEISEIIKGRSAKAISHKVSRLGLFRNRLPSNRTIKPKYRVRYDNSYYRLNKDRIDQNKRIRIKRKKEMLVKLFGGKCVNCGYNKCIYSLDFHHKNDKEETISRLMRDSSKQKVLKE